jgi:hypothetical protein
MDFASLVEGDLPQRLISGLWQIDAPAPPTKRLSRRDYYHRYLSLVRRNGSYRDIAYQVERFVMSCAALVHISTIVLVCSLKEIICLLTKSV